MKTLLAALLCCSCATLQSAPRVDLGQYGGVLDEIYTHVGNHEILFCLDAVIMDNSTWRVTGIHVPLQAGDSASVQGDGCTQSVGEVHNHPLLGGEYMFRQISWFSETDENSFAARRNLRFTVLWFAPGKFTARVK